MNLNALAEGAENSGNALQRRRLWRMPLLCLPPILLVVAVVQFHTHVWLFVTSWATACQASLSFSISQSLLRLMSIELVMPSNHLVPCPLLLLPPLFPRTRVFSNMEREKQPWHYPSTLLKPKSYEPCSTPPLPPSGLWMQMVALFSCFLAKVCACKRWWHSVTP